MTESGTIRCLECGRLFKVPPEDWICPFCGGPVSQCMGVVHVRKRE